MGAGRARDPRIPTSGQAGIDPWVIGVPACQGLSRGNACSTYVYTDSHTFVHRLLTSRTRCCIVCAESLGATVQSCTARRHVQDLAENPNLNPSSKRSHRC